MHNDKSSFKGIFRGKEENFQTWDGYQFSVQLFWKLKAEIILGSARITTKFC